MKRILFASIAIVSIAPFVSIVEGRSEPTVCTVRAHTQYGWVCGIRRWADKDSVYASFRGVPFAKQPIGELRFKELEPPEPWDDFYEAINEGPNCLQKQYFYGSIMKSTSLSEACIYANIHVPISSLPDCSERRTLRDLQPPYGFRDDEINRTGLPIFVFVHGGGFNMGSGDSDLHGPEHLVSKGVIVMTFNYRLGPFGFLSLNSSIPGNNGMRDVLTFLRWVQNNAEVFGGNPDDVTLAGHSAGAAMVHLLTLSEAANGLFKRIMLMSGTASRSFFTTSPVFAKIVATEFVTRLGINSTDPETIHQQLIEMPIKSIEDVHYQMQDKYGMNVFSPVVESPVPGFTTILDDDPEVLMAKGRGNDIPMIIGYTNAECETFRPRFQEIDIVSRYTENHMLALSPYLIFSKPLEDVVKLANKVEKRYFSGEYTLDNYVRACSDSFFIYPAIHLALERAAKKGAPVFLYEFSYEPEKSVMRTVTGSKYKGAGHAEDLTFIFKVNSITPNFTRISGVNEDEVMNDWLTNFVINFMHCSDPVCNRNYLSAWPRVETKVPQYQNIFAPKLFRIMELTDEQIDMLRFFDGLYKNKN